MLAAAIGGVFLSPLAAAADPWVPPEVDRVLQADGPAFLREALDMEGDVTMGAVTVGRAHEVDSFSTAYAHGDTSGQVTDPGDEWVAVWTNDGRPAGLMRAWVDPGTRTPTIAGVDGDAETAAAIAAWGGSGVLVEEPWRARWFVLTGATLVTLAGPSYPDAPIATSYPVSGYAADIAGYLRSAQDTPSYRIGPFPILPALVGLLCLAAATLLIGLRVAASRRA